MPANYKPIFITYISKSADVVDFVDAGFKSLIIDVPLFSLGAVNNDCVQTDVSVIKQIYDAIKQYRSDIEVSLCIDVLFYDKFEKPFQTVIKYALSVGIEEFRVQDFGLAYLIKEISAKARIIFTPMIGYANSKSLQACVKSMGLSGVSLPIEMSQNDIILATHSLANVTIDLLVQGSILLQYSPRRMISGAIGEDMLNSTENYFNIEATDQNNRKCFFNDNQHGLTMYAGIERSLLKKMDTLITLPIDRWLFDCRQSSNSLKYAIKSAYAYNAYYDAVIEGDNNYVMKAYLDEFYKLTLRKQHAGFFMANRTDKTDFEAINKRESRRDVGMVIDSIRDKNLTIELYEDIAIGELLEFHTPEGRIKKLRLDSMKDLHDCQLSSAKEGDIIRITWMRAVVVKTKLRR